MTLSYTARKPIRRDFGRLPEAVLMRDGDGIRLEGGGWLLVRAAVETLTEIACGDPGGLMRIAWHLGNRHLPTQIEAGRLRIREDHVITEMVGLLGGEVRTVQAPFDPEGGAYASERHEDRAHAG